MQKFINKPENLTKELLEGLVLANPELVTLVEENLLVNKKMAQAERVTVVALGATGCEPALSGMVGEGLLDVFVAGDLFAAPGPQAVLDALQLADRGRGVLLIAGNHTGAVLSAEVAVRQVQKLGVKAELVLAQDNSSDAAREQLDGRRGLVGCVPLCKIAAGAAHAGKSLDEAAALARRFAQNTATLAVATQAGTHPATGRLLAEKIPEGTMRVGVGELGDGGEEAALTTADELPELLLPRLLNDLEVQQGEKLLLIVNGCGQTTLMEQLVVFRSCYAFLEEQGMEVVAQKVGNLLTAQETSGLQVCIARMDEELLSYWNSPCCTPYYKN